MRKNASRSKGFTLIELLVVIAIIGILAGIIIVAVDNLRSKTRDTRRRAELRSIASALEDYFVTNNKYPINGTTFNDNSAAESGNWSGWFKGYFNNQILPVDPLNKTVNSINYVYQYYSTPTGSKYMLVANFENASDSTRMTIVNRNRLFDPTANASELDKFSEFLLSSAAATGKLSGSAIDPNTAYVLRDQAHDYFYSGQTASGTGSECYGPGPDVMANYGAPDKIVDNLIYPASSFVATGGWIASSVSNPYCAGPQNDGYGNAFLYIKGVAIGAGGYDGAKYIFPGNVSEQGDYDIYAWFPSSQKNSSSVRYTVVSGPSGTPVTETFNINEKNGGHWQRIGTHHFAMYGTNNYVLIDNKITDYNPDPAQNPFVSADAIKFVKQ